MGNQNILDEYLVKLGFLDDKVGYARFANQLRDASSLVNNQYFSMVKKVLEFQAASVGMFAAIGAGAVGLVDRVAMADQEYRLLALHMYTSLPVARELKVALDALGQPLENVMWDPELAGRFHQLVKDQQALTEELGPNFENQMLKVRDLRFEFTRFGVEIQYLSMMVVQDLAKAFGTSMDGLFERMRNFNDWFIANMPRIADWIATKLKPILIDVAQVMESTWELIKATAAAFTTLVGAISGDTSLEGTTASFEKMATAIQKAAGWLNGFIQSLTRGEIIFAHLVAAIADLNNLNFSGAKDELKAASGLLDTGSGAVVGAGIGGAVGSVFGGPGLGTAIGAGVGGAIGSVVSEPAGTEKTKLAIASAARAMGVPPELALAVAKVESNFQQFDASGKLNTSKVAGSHAMGIFQLEPGTAKDMGVDATNPMFNIIGGVKYLSQLLKKFKGNQEQALAAYSGQGNKLADPNYVAKVLQAEAGYTVNITVNAQTNATAKDIASEVAKVQQQVANQRTQRTIAEFQQPGWSY